MREEERFDAAINCLPLRLKRFAQTISREEKQKTEEIRLRTGQPMTLLREGREYPAGEGTECVVAQEDLETVCNIVTGFSRYTALETLKKGYLTAEGGFRVGVTGFAVRQGGEVTALRDFSSMAIRIARERIGLAEDLAQELQQEGSLPGTLIAAAPGLGKTTLLRDLVRCLSYGGNGFNPLRMGLVDERGEIAAMHKGVPQLDVGPYTDVLDACPKAEGIELLLRAMNPQAIAVDEITAAEDIAAMSRAANSGVSMIATIHAADRRELMAKPLFRQLQRQKVFRKLITIRSVDGERRYRMEELT